MHIGNKTIKTTQTNKQKRKDTTNKQPSIDPLSINCCFTLAVVAVNRDRSNQAARNQAVEAVEQSLTQIACELDRSHPSLQSLRHRFSTAWTCCASCCDPCPCPCLCHD